MDRVALFFKLKQGKLEGYISRHKDIGSSMQKVLDAAGIRNYSIWSLNEMLFAYYEVDNTESAKQVLSKSPVYENWRKEMEEYVEIDISGKKEWPLLNVFFKE